MTSKLRQSVLNFSPGPAKLPDEVIERAERELSDFANTGISILETSHRSKEFLNVLHLAEKNLKLVIGDFPESHKVLFLQGGGTGQFAAVPLNLMNLSKAANPTADYLVTGSWSSNAVKEAEKYLHVNRCINPPLKSYTTIPKQSTWQRHSDAAYLYYCANETIHGVEFDYVPDGKGVPVVADMSSNFLTRPVNVSKHGIIFAGAQKNIGTAGLTVAIVRDDLLHHASRQCPTVFEYKTMDENTSIYNTPPVFGIYLTNLVLEWIRDKGGVDEMIRRSELKSKLIYDVIDASHGFYHCPVDKSCRSRVNIPFRVGKLEGLDCDALEKAFLAGAEQRKMVSLKGHRSVGGIRASLYNAVSVPDTEKLADFMKEFHEKHTSEK